MSDKPKELSYYQKLLQKNGSIDDDNFYPSEGDGDHDCSSCQGKGWIDIHNDFGIPTSTRCKCVLKKDMIANLERMWRGLASEPIIPESPLKGKTNRNLWVTSTLPTFRKHLKHVAIRQSPHWDARVVSDSDLVTAWLATAELKGIDIIDPDVATAESLKYLTLQDIAIPSSLLVIRLGAKVARNSAMSEVLLESLMLREHVGLPTWIFDQPFNRLDDPEHLCYSLDLIQFLERESWPKISFETKHQMPTFLPPTDLPSVSRDRVTHTSRPTRSDTGLMKLKSNSKPKKKSKDNKRK